MFWSVLEQAASSGLPRLVLFPIAAYILGKNEFGLFATALSCALIVGVQPANGLATGLLRDLPFYQNQEQSQFVYTAVKMSHKFLMYSLFFAIVVVVGVYITGYIDWKTYFCLTFFGISLYAENQFMLILTPLRYKRQFRERSIWFVVCSVCVTVLGVIGCYLGGVAGLAIGMMTGNFIVYGAAYRKYLTPGVVFNPAQAKTLRSVWVHMTIAGVLVTAGPHLNRIVLRFFSDNESVADLFATTAIAYVFTAPISNLSGLLLSMISKYKSLTEISRNSYRMIWGLMIGGAVLGTVFFGLAAPILLKLLFPRFGGRATALFSILIWMIPANVAISFVRPLLTKFADVVWIPRINFIVLAITLILMFGLIPHWGLIGAAWSITVGNVAAALLQIVLFVVIFLKSKNQMQLKTCESRQF
jgi:O-antigen/teichoic acid export membrane protein